MYLFIELYKATFQSLILNATPRLQKEAKPLLNGF
jgi:hypothetical protein